ncbi:hypothetical protein GR212_15775 [Rhizobium lusitanum]|uniref:Uncharacterized protein n=1 Tax=Rhizobium lusitanum TaxID=293958 RepID=A0A6L9U931_9HYPH|nr:hypothetical protein [Rhizobium lusitanum]NEI71038.1 hypothetical protein [Rhizobium lusitanum]
MARGRKPNLKVVGGPSEAGKGHNSELTDEQQLRLLRGHVDKITSLKAKVASATAELRNAYKTAKSDGVPKEDIDFAIALEKDDDDKMIQRRRRETELARLLNHPIGTQFEMFDSDPRPLAERSFEDGKQAGLKGKDCAPDNAMGDEARNKWIEGWHAGQAILAQKFAKGPATPEVLRDSEKVDAKKVDDFDEVASK